MGTRKGTLANIKPNAPITREQGNENFLKISTKHFCLVFVAALALQVIELNLAHTHVLWSYLYVLVLTDILQALLKTHHGLRNDASLIVRTGSTYVGKLLSLGYVDYQVVVVNMLTYNLASVNLLTRIDEELTTILQLIDSVSKGSTVSSAIMLPLERRLISPLYG